uniref:Translocase of outer mitochondrial membrane 34 n=1 Tax=Acanthochromis polyacanthus TaxID=80966 RepID=A0A3Q1EWY0_9TELE
MPQKQKLKSWSDLKQAGNERFKTGQYGEATTLYSQAIKELDKSNTANLLAMARIDVPSWRIKPAKHLSPAACERHALIYFFNLFFFFKSSSAPSDKDKKKGQALKDEGNALVKKGEHKKAIEKYTQSLKLNPTEVTTYTNRALCYLSVKQYKDTVRDCDEALMIDGSNVKALYRRAQARKELKDVKACVQDLNSLLKVEPKNTAALKLLQEVQKK